MIQTKITYTATFWHQASEGRGSRGLPGLARYWLKSFAAEELSLSDETEALFTFASGAPKLSSYSPWVIGNSVAVTA